jgi:hypothetical protein
MEELGYATHLFAWSHCSSYLSCGAGKSCLPLLHRLMVFCQSGDSDKVHCEGQLSTEGEDGESIISLPISQSLQHDSSPLYSMSYK